MSNGPQTPPGEIVNWPMLKIKYDTDPAAIAKLLPPGIEPGANPVVTITIYNFPIMNEPEYGYVVSVDAICDGVEGEYQLANGIDQEAPVQSCQERWGQPKFIAEIEYYRMIDTVTAKCTHQGYTFLEFTGKVTGVDEEAGDIVANDWWVKFSRAVDMTPGNYDLPPKVVHVRSEFGTAHQETLDGKLTLRESPWDPIATLLPIRGEVKSVLWTPVFTDRQYADYKQLDGEAFWPFTETISGSRWPGLCGAPVKKLSTQ